MIQILVECQQFYGSLTKIILNIYTLMSFVSMLYTFVDYCYECIDQNNKNV